MNLNPINSFKNLEALVFLLHVVFPPFLQWCFSHVTLKSHFNIERGRGGKCMRACFTDFWRGLADWARFALKALYIQIHYSVIEPASLSLWSFVFLGLNHQFPSEFTFMPLTRDISLRKCWILWFWSRDSFSTRYLGCQCMQIITLS